MTWICIKLNDTKDFTCARIISSIFCLDFECLVVVFSLQVVGENKAVKQILYKLSFKRNNCCLESGCF